MRVVVFCGPTIKPDDVLARLDAEVRPPAKRGDVLAAAMSCPAAIGIVDGYFAHVPSVWHKEILWAMSEGIHVFGAASIGALRAAELGPFGMEGVGAIYEQFRRGALTDDDEVAVMHAEADQGYRVLSEAMVNIRATLAAAERTSTVSQPTRVALESIAKRLPYAERGFPMLLMLAERSELPKAELARLRAWLPTGRVDEKQEDARMMIARMAFCQEKGWRPKQVTYRFARTDAWQALWNEVESRTRSVRSPQGQADCESGIVSELLVDGASAQAHEAALARALCLEQGRRLGVRVDAAAVEAVIDDFRRERGLLALSAFNHWIEAQRLTEDELVPFFRREALVRRMRVAFGRETLAHLVDQLRTAGEYGSLRARAVAKEDSLAALGMKPPHLSDTKLTEAELWEWYFTKRLGIDVPADVESFARKEHTDIDHLRSAAIGEYLYETVARARGIRAWE